MNKAGFLIFVSTCLSVFLLMPALAQHEGHNMDQGEDHEGMQFDVRGMVMNSNHDTLPQNCSEISEDIDFTVRAGTEYALRESGKVFGFSQYNFQAKPCSRVTIHFFNEDQIRHQWMLHGLPRYLYPQGMFHLEASAGEHVMGTFIVPADDATYLVHCDITQHMEKGMKAQFVVGAGSGDLWSVPGLTEDFNREYRMPYGTYFLVAIFTVFGALVFARTVLKK